MFNSCFVLMPIGNSRLDQYYEKIIKPAVSDMGIRVTRADELYGTKPIIDDIVGEIKGSGIIIADVTGKNPNVMYELGFAHALNKGVVILTQHIDDIPFDFRHVRAVSYDPTELDFAQKLTEKIQMTINSVLSKQNEFRQQLPEQSNLTIPNANGYWKSIVLDTYTINNFTFYKLLGLIPVSGIPHAKSHVCGESHWVAVRNQSSGGKKYHIRKNDCIKFKSAEISALNVFDHKGKKVIARNIYIDEAELEINGEKPDKL